MLRLASNELVSAYITSQGILYIETFLKKKKNHLGAATWSCYKKKHVITSTILERLDK